MAKEIKLPKLKNPFESISARRASHLEINLVPDIKNEMIRALKLRNFIFFVCIVVASASVGVSLIFLSIAGGQQAIVSAKNNTLTNLSKTINSYSDLEDFLTIRDQLGNLSDIAKNKKLLSRIFGVISTLLPAPDSSGVIQISELNINLSGSNPTISFDAQANDNSDLHIDYNVLDSFKKSMQYMRYDYGTYVDRDGKAIPAYCMVESDTEGTTFYDADTQSYYAYWLINGHGCDPARDDDAAADNADATNTTARYQTEEYNGQTVVRIYRTPQFKDWYKTEAPTSDNVPYLSLDGEISNVPHFESSCTTYAGYDASEYASNPDETVLATVKYTSTPTSRFDTATETSITWVSTNDSCLLVPDGTDGITISDSSNGKGADGDLVLRFSAIITLNSQAFNFNNHHLLAIAPSGRHNVTDSYVQIQNMFAERAADVECAPGDTACTRNLGGGGN